MAKNQRKRKMTRPELARWILAVSPPDESGCRPWPKYLSQGWPITTLHSSPIFAHRVVLEDRDGPPPDGHCAWHICGKRHCVNPAHLVWISYGMTLTPVDVQTIRERLEAGETGQALAVEYGVTRGMISHIKQRRVWRDT